MPPADIMSLPTITIQTPDGAVFDFATFFQAASESHDCAKTVFQMVVACWTLLRELRSVMTSYETANLLKIVATAATADTSDACAMMRTEACLYGLDALTHMAIEGDGRLVATVVCRVEIFAAIESMMRRFAHVHQGVRWIQVATHTMSLAICLVSDLTSAQWRAALSLATSVRKVLFNMLHAGNHKAVLMSMHVLDRLSHNLMSWRLTATPKTEPMIMRLASDLVPALLHMAITPLNVVNMPFCDAVGRLHIAGFTSLAAVCIDLPSAYFAVVPSPVTVLIDHLMVALESNDVGVVNSIGAMLVHLLDDVTAGRSAWRNGIQASRHEAETLLRCLRGSACIHVPEVSAAVQRALNDSSPYCVPTWDDGLMSGVMPVGCCFLMCPKLAQCVEFQRPVRRCAGCRRARYCSHKCQRGAWKTGHKRACEMHRQLTYDVEA